MNQQEERGNKISFYCSYAKINLDGNFNFELFLLTLFSPKYILSACMKSPALPRLIPTEKQDHVFSLVLVNPDALYFDTH